MAQDAKDAQTLMELREKMQMNVTYMGMVQQQQRRAVVGMRRAQLTLDELQALPEAAPMYRSVGKAYFLAPQPELVQELQADVQAGGDQLKELERQAGRAKQALDDLQREVGEVTRGNPAAAAAFRRLMGGGA